MGCGVVERHLEMAQPTKKNTFFYYLINTAMFVWYYVQTKELDKLYLNYTLYLMVGTRFTELHIYLGNGKN